jgi:hypothetical protein
MNTCLVCGYNRMEFPPADFTICACCGTEFGYDDRVLTHGELTQRWVENNCPWFDPDEPRPRGWNAYKQLIEAGLGRYVPFRTYQIRVQADALVTPVGIS